jgi:rubrerythrin
MKIFDFAMDMEKEGEKYYRQIAAESDNPGYRNIFNMLADDEVKHFNIFRDLKEEHNVDFPDTTVLDTARKTFITFVAEGDPFKKEAGQKELYAKALDIERKSRDFYLEKAEETADESKKKILKKIAGEEEKHFKLIDKLLGFIREPETFLENAEFFQKDDYWMLVT